VPVTIEDDEEHIAIAVRAGEFELADDEDDEDEDDEDDTVRRRDSDEDDEDDDEEGEDYDEDEEEEDGWVLACCSEKCREELAAALARQAPAEQ
jgi:hypothetical protein